MGERSQLKILSLGTYLRVLVPLGISSKLVADEWSRRWRRNPGTVQLADSKENHARDRKPYDFSTAELTTLRVFRSHWRDRYRRVSSSSELIPPSSCATDSCSIIAIMIGRLRMSVDECLAEYAELSKKVFSERKQGVSKEMSKASNLEAAIKSVIKKKLGDDMQDAPLEDPLDEECCKT